MKYLIMILVCSIITVFAYAEGTAPTKDPQDGLYQNAHTAASVVDNTGAFEAVQTQYHKIALDKSCPACNLQGGLDLVDENGPSIATSSGNKSKTSTGEDAGAESDSRSPCNDGGGMRAALRGSASQEVTY